MKPIKTNKIILFLIVLATGLASASCDQPTGDQMQAQEEEPAAEAVTSFDAMARFPEFYTKDRKCPKAAFDMFLKLDGIDGESTDDQHEDWIVLLSVDGGWSFRATSSLSSRGIGKAKVRAQPFVITKPIDKASPELRRHADSGEPIPAGVFELRMTCGEEEAETETLTIVLEEITIAHVNTHGSSQQTPTEFVSFNYSKIALLLPAVQSAPPEPTHPPRDDE